MKINKKLVAVSLATVLACGTFAGCDLVTTDAQKDMQQVIAEVDISLGEDFAEGGKYAAYADCDRWNKMALINIAESGIFAADRSISEYANNIWHISPLKNAKK